MTTDTQTDRGCVDWCKSIINNLMEIKSSSRQALTTTTTTTTITIIIIIIIIITY